MRAWYRLGNGWICRTCYNRLIYNPKRNPEHNKKWNPINNPKHFWFNGKNIQLKERILIGVCNWCRAVYPFDTKKTDMHHDENKYDESNPQKHAIEICARCHTKETRRLEKVTSEVK